MNNQIFPLMQWQALLDLSNTMLSLAHSGQWEELIEQEVNYLTLVDSIAQSNPGLPMSPATQDQAKQLLQKVLENEEQLKGLLRQRMDDLRDLIGQNGRQKSLNAAYGNIAGNVLIPNNFNQ